MVDDVGHRLAGNGLRPAGPSPQGEAVGLVEIGRAGETEHLGDVALRGPAVDNGAQADFRGVRAGGLVGALAGGGHVMRLVHQERKMGQSAEEVAQLVGHAHARHLVLVEQGVVGVLVDTVEDDLLGVHHGHEAKAIGNRAVCGDFLRVGVLGAVGTRDGGAGVEHLEGQAALEAPGILGREYPFGIEVADFAQAGDNRALGAGGRKHQEVVGEGRVVGVLLGEVEVEVNHCRHEVGLARAHGEGKEIVGIGDVVKEGREVGLASLGFHRHVRGVEQAHRGGGRSVFPEALHIGFARTPTFLRAWPQGGLPEPVHEDTPERRVAAPELQALTAI